MRSPSASAALIAVLLVTACSADKAADEPAPEAVVATPAADEEPGLSLAFEWSANGFEQVSGEYKWTGSGVRDDVFEPHLALSVPETDDAIWSSSCASGGKVETRLYLAPPRGMKDNRATFRFETDRSAATRSYPARYIADGQYDGFAIVQSASDPMFAEMKAGKWAYIQIGEGSDATKLRVSLAGAAKSLAAFLPACSGAKVAKAAPSSTTANYTCDDGRAITASYLGNDTDTPVVRLSVEGEAVLLPQAISGSGARYEGEASGMRYQWLTKAEDGVLIVGDAEGSAEQTTICREG